MSLEDEDEDEDEDENEDENDADAVLERTAAAAAVEELEEATMFSSSDVVIGSAISVVVESNNKFRLLYPLMLRFSFACTTCTSEDDAII